jgi:hypothetical protein
VTVSADDDVIVDFDAKAARDPDNSFRHFNVRARRRRIAAGMVVKDAL